MAQTFTREELYALVWAEPMTRIAARLGLSGNGLVKACHRSHVPVPPRGYWARETHGKRVTQTALPARPPGHDGSVTIGASRSWTPALSREDLLGPIPPEPTFSEPIEHVRNRAVAMIGKVTVPQKLDRPHPVIARLLQEDDRRREKQAAWGTASSVYSLLYDTPHQRRRLRILSAVFVALARCGCRAEAWGGAAHDEPAEEFVIAVGHQQVRLRASVIDPKGRSVRKREASRTKDLRLWIELDPGDRGQSSGQSWEDDAEPLEKKAAAIAVAVLVKGEEQYRFGVLNAHAWRIQRKAALEEEIRKAREDVERLERERLQALERQRVERLLGEAEPLCEPKSVRYL